ncbi:ABC transporter substrate-binding protein [Georgenia sp. Z1491]|uniref:ABC transporter substrate-binding protein n=1 Tax=Georgenia sp. Z1491 TaxID=3416707 RepID=UPI003CF4E62D
MTTTHLRAAVAGTAAVLVLTACGSGEEEASTDEESAPSIVVGTMPLADLAPFHHALDTGLFEEAGLDVEFVSSSAGAAQIAAMMSGDVHITYSNFVSVLQGAQEGLPLRIVRENNRSGPQGIYVPADSPIEDPADLSGASVAINSLGNIQELTSRAVLESHGVDLATVEFVEMPPPDMGAALEQGHVDAAWLVEPFLTRGVQAGHREVASAFEGPTENLPVAGWLTTEEYLAENADVVDSFIAVMDQAMAEAEDDPGVIAEAIPGYTEIDPQLASELSPPALTPTSDLTDFDVLRDLMLEYGLLDEELDVDALMYTP